MKKKLTALCTKRNKILLIGLIIFVVLFALLNANTSKGKVLSDAQIISNVGALTKIPDTNIDPPGIFRIEDPSQMPAFFKDAAKGDVALLFLKSQTAVIYSPVRNYIINQGPIVNDTPVKTQVAPVKTEPVSTSSKKIN